MNNNRFLVLDEATSNVDMETDQQVQRVIREHFQNVTVIGIAHRLQTVRDYDRVIVMEEGRVAEMGTIRELLGKRSGLFRKMIEYTVTKMGLLDIDNLTIFFISKLFLDLIWSIIS